MREANGKKVQNGLFEARELSVKIETGVPSCFGSVGHVPVTWLREQCSVDLAGLRFSFLIYRTKSGQELVQGQRAEYVDLFHVTSKVRCQHRVPSDCHRHLQILWWVHPIRYREQ